MSATDFQPRNLLITGGAGFIGSNFVHGLLKERRFESIVVLDLLTYAGSLENLPDPGATTGYQFVKGDICDRTLVDQLLRRHEIDTIVHFAAESHVDRSINGPLAFVQTNVVGTFTLLEAARHYWLRETPGDAHARRFHHISTDEVFGTLAEKDPAFTEQTPYAPNSPYSAAKAGADHLVRAYWHTYKLPVVTSNCSNNYGPRQNAEKFIPTIIRACYLGEKIPVYGNGSNRRDWLYVGDHCQAIELVLRRGRLGETYNVGGDSEIANLEVARHVCAAMDELRAEGKPHERLITFVPDRPGHDWRYAIDCKKLRAELGWRPAHEFARGLRQTVAWYLGEAGWRKRVADGTYAGTRLGIDPARKDGGK